MADPLWRAKVRLLHRLLPDLPPATHEVTRRRVTTPLRDGVDLRGDLYLPDGPAPGATVVLRSPYGRIGPFAATALALAERGHPVLVQSVRGTAGSGGTFTPQLHEAQDGADTLRWVRAQEWFTGRLATAGPSYLGYAQWAAAAELLRTEPAAAPDAMVLEITMPDFGAVTWHDGAFALRNALGWTRMMRRIHRPVARIGILLPDPALRRAFDVLPLRDGDLAATGEHVHWYQDWLRRDDLGDPYWTQQSHTAAVSGVTAPVSMITGWYDIFLPWQVRSYAALVAAGNQPELRIGPWGHLSRGMARYTHTGTLDFLERRLPAAGDPAPPPAEPVQVYVTGAREWRGYPSWPPPGVADRDLFLGPGGTLGDAPGAGPPSRYVYDPGDPTPALGGPSLLPQTLPVDNAEHERRDDVLTFTTAPLEDPVEVLGEPVATVRLRTDRPTTDLFVRLCDVHPDGRSMTICDGIRRIGGRGTRDADPEPDADGARAVRVTLWPTAHRFPAGHRIRVQVSSGAHPRYARNTGDPAPAADAAILHRAHQEVLHDPGRPSTISLPVPGTG